MKLRGRRRSIPGSAVCIGIFLIMLRLLKEFFPKNSGFDPVILVIIILVLLAGSILLGIFIWKKLKAFCISRFDDGKRVAEIIETVFALAVIAAFTVFRI